MTFFVFLLQREVYWILKMCIWIFYDNKYLLKAKYIYLILGHLVKWFPIELNAVLIKFNLYSSAFAILHLKKIWLLERQKNAV